MAEQNNSQGGHQSHQQQGHHENQHNQGTTRRGNTANRGFASMDGEKQRRIASKGGQEAHRQGTAHEFTSEEARAAGRKGGEAVSRNREHMAEIGRKGGANSHGGGRQRAGQKTNNKQGDDVSERISQTHSPNQAHHHIEGGADHEDRSANARDAE